MSPSIDAIEPAGLDHGVAGPGEAEVVRTQPDDGSEPTQTGPLGLVALIGAFVALGVLSLPVLIVVLGIVFMILMHELGHYITAKRAGMKVTEFFIGFGPRIWSFHRGETEYGIKAIWVGAYVKIIGMNNLDEVDAADESRTYRQKSYPRRLSVAVAGSAMHFLMALVLLFGIFALVGESVNQAETNAVIGALTEPGEFAADVQASELEIDDDFAALLEAGEMPASAAGLQEGDEVLAIDGREVPNFKALEPMLLDKGGDVVAVTYERDGETLTTDVQVGWISNGEAERGFLGIGPATVTERMSPVTAAGRSLSTFAEITTESAKALARFFTPRGLSDFTSLAVNAGDDQPADAPVRLGTGGNPDEGRIISILGATQIGAEAARTGVAELLSFFVLINIFIGVFNLVPLLPLDGGHVAVATYERIREIGRKTRYHADVYKLLPLTYGVVLLLVTVGILAIYADLLDSPV